MAARILVADDSVTIQKVVELTFSKEDFVLVQARSGEEAIRKAKEERPDLVLLDLVMPDKNGYEVCAAMRAEPMLRAVPIILLTGTFETFDKGKGVQAGANDFVTKPFESQVLISKVKQLLFTKTVDMAPAAGPAKSGKAVPPKEAPHPSPATAASPPTGMPPRPSPAPGLPRGVAPGILRGVAPPSSTPTPPLGTVGVPSRPSGAPAPSPAAPLPPPQARPAVAPPGPTPTKAAVPPERTMPPPPSVPPRVARTLDLSPPSEEISQDRVRSVVEPPTGPLSSPPAKGFGELSLEDLTTLPVSEAAGRPGDLHLELEKAASGPAAVPEELSLEMPSLEPEPAQKKEEVAPTLDEAAALPESLSLEELLAAEETPPHPSAKAAPVPLDEELTGEPVFDLTGEMGAPSLPLVEVGAGEPPTLSIEDLLGSIHAAPPPVEAEPSVPRPEAQPEELPGAPVFDLTGAQEMPSPPRPTAEAEEPTVPSVEDLQPRPEITPVETGMMGLQDLDLELISGPPVKEPTPQPAPTAAPPVDLGALVAPGGVTPEAPPLLPTMEAGAGLAEVPAAAVAPTEISAVPPRVPSMPGMEPAPPVAATMPPPGRAGVPEVAAMRQEVAERVAHELVRDLSDKLLERIERIVWEVVPDLAEILVTKEIERIRSQAEDKQSS